ncbi:MAG: hypothetical protein K2I44_05425 [Muribaculaceae bacterium]|nr:hypothetical protein [Muribaculaceae bacterium]
MSEEIKRNWDDGEIAAVRAWYESTKGFDQVEKEINLPSGTLFKLVNEIPDYRGTRHSLGKWLRRMGATAMTPDKSRKKKRPMPEKTSLPKSDNDKIEQQLRRELDAALKKVACLEALQKKDAIKREFLEEQLVEYRKLVKPSQSKKSNTK